MKITPIRRYAVFASSVFISLCSLGSRAAIFDYRDALDIAVAFPDETLFDQRQDRLTLYVADDIFYDDNLYRLPSYVTDLAALPGIGPNPSRHDFYDSITGGLDGEWLIGNRQSVDLDLRADDNRYFRNTDLDNVSSLDHLAWNWGLGGVLSGSVGADYSRIIGGFVNTGSYSRDMVVRSDVFTSIRYQLGPHWGLFGGLMDQNYKLTAPEATYNNSRAKAVDLGFDYATSASNRIGFDYRYTDDRAPNSATLNDITFNPDYREDRARLLATYALSEKTILNGEAGFIRRDYPSTAIGSFSGVIWRLSAQWQPTPKTELVLGTWRQITADLTAQTDYYVSKGVTVSPVWTPTEKLSLSLVADQQYLNYIGANPVGVGFIGVLEPGRRDTLSTQTLNLGYKFNSAFSFSITAGHERRNTNFSQYEYSDFRTDASVTYKFFRYGAAAE